MCRCVGLSTDEMRLLVGEWATTDERDPGDEDRRPVGVTPYRASQIADELEALEDSGSNEATQALIRKLLEGKLK
jgi:hypothetical protein